jgi:hypothetical protein
MAKETRTKDKRGTLPFVVFRRDCDLDFRARLCWSLLVYRRRAGAGCREHEVVTRTRLSRKGARAALARLAAGKLVFKLGPAYYARRPGAAIAHEKKGSGGEKWYKRFAYWKCHVEGRPAEDVLLALLRSLAQGGGEARGQSDAGLATLLGLHPKTVGRTVARLEARGSVGLRRRRNGYDAVLRPAPPEVRPAAPKPAATPFARGYELLAGCRVPAPFVKDTIIPLVEEVARGDPAFDLAEFVAMIADADQRHRQTGIAAHPGHLIRHMLRQRLPAADVQEQAARIRHDQRMAEAERRCRESKAYWALIDHLKPIDDLPCCGTGIKFEAGAPVYTPDAGQARVVGAIEDRLPGASVAVKDYRLVCRKCRAVHRCRTADVFASVGGWASVRHVLISHGREGPSATRVAVWWPCRGTTPTPTACWPRAGVRSPSRGPGARTPPPTLRPSSRPWTGKRTVGKTRVVATCPPSPTTFLTIYFIAKTPLRTWRPSGRPWPRRPPGPGDTMRATAPMRAYSRAEIDRAEAVTRSLTDDRRKLVRSVLRHAHEIMLAAPEGSPPHRFADGVASAAVEDCRRQWCGSSSRPHVPAP